MLSHIKMLTANRKENMQRTKKCSKNQRKHIKHVYISQMIILNRSLLIYQIIRYQNEKDNIIIYHNEK